jgi:hypothetical protein
VETTWSASENYPHNEFHSQNVKRLARRIKSYQRHIDQFSARLNASRNQRLVIGLICFAFAFAFMSKLNSLATGPAFLLTFGIFVIWIGRTRRLAYFLDLLKIRQLYLRRTEAKIRGEFSSNLTLEIKDDPYADLHLFGEKSIFALIDETFSLEAKSQLRDQLIFGLGDGTAIARFQKQTEDLSCSLFSCERFLHLGHRESDEPISSQELEKTMQQPLIKSGYAPAVIAHLVLFPTYLTVFFMIGYGQIKAPLSLPVVFYALFSLLTLKTISGSFRQSEIMERYLNRFKPTLAYLERRKGFFGGLYTSHGESFSKSIGRLKLCVSFLSIQSHGLAYIIVNGLMPWTLLFTGLAEQWRRSHKDKFSSLLEELKNLEVVCSSVIVSSYHSKTKPEFHSERIVSGHEVYHPMIPRKEVVANSFTLDNDQTVILLTGSNMSGKSTFMRAVAVNQILALAGFPVFAERFSTTHAKVVSCLQVKDNLDQGYSYFYSEVRKVKDILERSKAGDALLFFIDEIFKGTNNKERFLGSKAVIQSLSQSSQAMGIVSTHDLELSELEKSAPTLKNFHFRDDVESDQLIFNYKIQQGPCPTTNALKIMAIEGLPV